MEALHENCFGICATKAPELPFLSVQEGLCFRNCLTKFAVFYPSLGMNLRHGDFLHYEKKLIEETAKKNPEVRKFTSDPWEKERTKLFDALQAKGLIRQ